ncbi:MAG TPA: hypothetical protein VM534_03805, partial [Thermoanaerobaculia bacterium]|nr:hypothetical protein [Thermoanaerobaculia bacterium]
PAPQQGAGEKCGLAASAWISNMPNPPPATESSLSRLLRRLSLKPYGEELLTRSGDFWIFSARLIIVTMALAEAMAWGYMGSLMSRAHPLLAAAVAGSFIFILIWIIDASFMTLDLSRGFYERALSGRRSGTRVERLKLAGGMAARIGIVTASLVITAPFLAQAIFAEDVRDEMARRNASQVAATRQKVERPFLTRLENLRREQQLLERERVAEAAGVGPSGRYGRGPALETIERQLSEKVAEVHAVEQSRSSELARFDQLPAAEMEQRYGLRFLSAGVHSSSELLEDLLANPQFSSAETSVRAFLAFLFLGLLILKSFQPRSIAVYYNEQLHSIYDEYRKGLFDSYLPEAERSDAGGSIDPLRFEEWCITTLSAIRQDDQRRRQAASESGIHDLLIEQWQKLEATTLTELEDLVRRNESMLAATEELEAGLHAARTDAALAAEELKTVESAHQSMRKQIESGGMDGQVFEQAVAAAKDLDERRRTRSAKLRTSEHEIERLTRRLGMRAAETTGLREQIAAREAVLAGTRKRIADERHRQTELIAGRALAWTGNS